VLTFPPHIQKDTPSYVSSKFNSNHRHTDKYITYGEHLQK